MQVASQKAQFATFFSKLEECRDKDGYTFLEHLKEMFNRILLNPEAYPLDKFEELSYLIKLTHLKLKQPLTDQQVKNMAAVLTEKQEWVNKYFSKLSIVFVALKN